MAKFETLHDNLNGSIERAKELQDTIVRGVLIENGRSMGGLIGHINGSSGNYDLEYIFLDPDEKSVKSENGMVPIVCHLDFPAFEIDVDFFWMPFDERQQIVELLIKEAQKL